MVVLSGSQIVTGKFRDDDGDPISVQLSVRDLIFFRLLEKIIRGLQ